jgi:integrase
MARTVKDARLETRAARQRLAISGVPFYKGLDQGIHLGYRKGASGGRWVLRWYKGAGGYGVETIGTADDKADADGVAVLSFAQAQAVCRARHVAHTRAAKGLPAKAAGPFTVGDAIEGYLAYLDGKKGVANKDARWRAQALILPSLGAIACVDLTSKHLRDWLEATAKTAPRVRTGKGAEQRYRPDDGGQDGEQPRRRRATANRTWTLLRAALNAAWREGKIASDDAWRRVKSFKGAGAARLNYLSVDECRRLINTAEGGFRDLVRAALATGCRFGELAALRVRDFDADAGTVHVTTSKTGKGRHVVLTEEGEALFRALAAGRAEDEPMLRRDDGSAWYRSSQVAPMTEARRRAGIGDAVSFHSLRHTYASLSVMAGAPLLVIAQNLGHANTRMVEQHYGHLSKSYVADAIRAAAPRFGFVDDRTVTPIAVSR